MELTRKGGGVREKNWGFGDEAPEKNFVKTNNIGAERKYQKS